LSELFQKYIKKPLDKGVTETVGKLGKQVSDKNLITIGIRASSKTSFLGCFALACDLKSQTQPNFSHYLRERTSGIRQVPCDLARGRFPAATPPGVIYEADEILRWKYPFGERRATMRFCETAGEDIQNIAGAFTDSLYEQNTNWQDAEVLNRYICNANAYLFMLPVSTTNIPGMPNVDKMPDGLHEDPDLICSRILSQIYGFKKDSGSPRIEGIGIVFTKYDLVETYCKSNGMNLYTTDGAQKFMNTYFRQTSAILKWMQEDGSGLTPGVEVRYFPFHIQVKIKVDAKGNREVMKGENCIAVDIKRNLPIFAEQTCYDIIDWTGDILAK
jgi:hypothetical protein